MVSRCKSSPGTEFYRFSGIWRKDSVLQRVLKLIFITLKKELCSRRESWSAPVHRCFIFSLFLDVQTWREYGHRATLSWTSHLISHTLRSQGMWLRLVQDNNRKKTYTLQLSDCLWLLQLTFVSFRALSHALQSMTTLVAHKILSQNLLDALSGFSNTTLYSHGYQLHHDQCLK